ncbi:hypothetical protein MANES_13G076069v8 [Manihot esculenta]|uniref:Uncharacterized protein n=1 Tax=Manihot esculenta TaxID=3983 RepID=A0ACB7GKB9_MANES|nr:hypothetical protein MANES_13G076069v8 [Manihot esculenta]
MDAKKIVLRLNIINCLKCKMEVLKAVAKLEGINEVSVDGNKGELTVIGNVDPVLLTKQLRKKKKGAVIISVGPPKKETPKKEAQKLCESLPSYCKQCQLVAVGFSPYDDGQLCSIL